MPVDYATGVGAAANAVQVTAPPSSTVTGTAATTGISNALISSFSGREAAKGIVGKISGYGKQLKRFTPSAIIGGVATAPFQNYTEKKEEKYKNDKEFNGSHFAQIMAPAVASSYLGTGVLSNMIEHSKEIGKGKMTAGDIIAKTVSPKAIHSGVKRELSTVGKAFRSVPGNSIGGRMGVLARGIVSGVILGSDLISPAGYLGKIFNSKKKGKDMEKQAGIIGKYKSARKAYKEAIELQRLQEASSKSRPELIKNLKQKRNKASTEMSKQVSKGIGGAAATAYIANSVYDSSKRRIQDAKENLGHRGAEYGGVII